jgi:hypothetical protein
VANALLATPEEEEAKDTDQPPLSAVDAGAGMAAVGAASAAAPPLVAMADAMGLPSLVNRAAPVSQKARHAQPMMVLQCMVDGTEHTVERSAVMRCGMIRAAMADTLDDDDDDDSESDGVDGALAQPVPVPLPKVTGAELSAVFAFLRCNARAAADADAGPASIAAAGVDRADGRATGAGGGEAEAKAQEEKAEAAVEVEAEAEVEVEAEAEVEVEVEVEAYVDEDGLYNREWSAADIVGLIKTANFLDIPELLENLCSGMGDCCHDEASRCGLTWADTFVGRNVLVQSTEIGAVGESFDSPFSPLPIAPHARGCEVYCLVV